MAPVVVSTSVAAEPTLSPAAVLGGAQSYVAVPMLKDQDVIGVIAMVANSLACRLAREVFLTACSFVDASFTMIAAPISGSATMIPFGNPHRLTRSQR